MRKLLAPRAGRAGYPGRHPGGVVEEQVTPGELPAKMRVHTHRVAEPVGDALIAAQTGDGQARSAVDHPVEWRTRPGRGGGGFCSGRTRMCLLGMRLRQYANPDRRQCDNHPADRQRALRYPIRRRLARPVARSGRKRRACAQGLGAVAAIAARCAELDQQACRKIKTAPTQPIAESRSPSHR